MSLFDDIRVRLKSLGFSTVEYPNGFLEFYGSRADSTGQMFSVEGSIEVQNNADVFYSVVYSTEDWESDGIIGTFHAPVDVNSVVDYIVTPEFVEAS